MLLYYNGEFGGVVCSTPELFVVLSVSFCTTIGRKVSEVPTNVTDFRFQIKQRHLPNLWRDRKTLTHPEHSLIRLSLSHVTAVPTHQQNLCVPLAQHA